MDFNEWTQNAINRIAANVNFNQRFELKDLFEGCEWDRLSKGERISFGKYFANRQKTVAFILILVYNRMNALICKGRRVR